MAWRRTVSVWTHTPVVEKQGSVGQRSLDNCLMCCHLPNPLQQKGEYNEQHLDELRDILIPLSTLQNSTRPFTIASKNLHCWNPKQGRCLTRDTIHNDQCSIGNTKSSRDLRGEIHVAWGVNQVNQEATAIFALLDECQVVLRKLVEQRNCPGERTEKVSQLLKSLSNLQLLPSNLFAASNKRRQSRPFIKKNPQSGACCAFPHS